MEHQLATQTRTLEVIPQKDVSTPKQALVTRPPAHPMLRLQRAIGNQAVQHMVQTKLVIGPPGDIYEQEADRVAEQVRSFAIPPSMQRKCACGGIAGSDGECADCRMKQLALRRRSTRRVESPTAPPIVHDALRSSGQALDPATRDFMEPSFGHDFSQVRIHTDGQAAESARAVNALAYTVGQDVVFGSGQYAPDTVHGKSLLAHELTHVVQQSGGRLLQRYKVPFGPNAECDKVVNWINSSGPYAKTSGAAKTKTPLKVTWGRHKFDGEAPDFDVTAPDVKVNLEKIPPDMPVWSPKDPDVKAAWDAGMADLSAHEQEHVMKGESYQRIVQNQLRMMSVKVSAPDVKKADLIAHPQFQAAFDLWVSDLQQSHDSIDPYKANVTCPPKKTM